MRGASMRVLVPILSAWMMFPSAGAAQKAVLGQELGALYRLTTVNAEGLDVTTGVTLLLKKNGLSAGAQNTCGNEYRGGAIALASSSKAICGGAVRTIAKATSLKSIPGVGTIVGAAQGAVPATRPFVAGEKVWVTKIDIKDAIVFGLISDLINGVRYKAEVRFQIFPETAATEQSIAEVFDIVPAQPPPAPPPASVATIQPPPAPANTTATTPRFSAAPAPAKAPPVVPTAVAPPAVVASVETPIAPLANDNPPPVSPRSTVATGMTPDQLVALLGQPDTITNIGSKKVYSYKIMKVSFVGGKAIPVEDSAEIPSVDLLPYEIGLGVMVVGAAAYWIGRRHIFARVPDPSLPAAVPQHVPAAAEASDGHSRRSQSPPAAGNAIQRLDELETLRDLGILSGDEFETEKHKLRKL
jgi:hypothetical protein